ncbi:MAG: cysteine-rich small domain-containing protein [Oscillospiraceae bacterium]|nr:cysteine-rich small domain-containing protein [Oscillospiraceae bacterium]
MNNSHEYFQNKDCKYFPCHKLPDCGHFNCLFCYCPLYILGDDCGGNFKRSDSGVKNCADCNLPHMPEYYAAITEKLKEARKNGKL